MKTVVTFGTFDLLHIGHINILKRASRLGSRLIVGVSTDRLSFEKKGVYPVYSQQDRLAIVSSIKYVDEVFLEESLEKKAEYLKKFKADVLVMGDDWEGKFDSCKNLCEVIYLPRTEGISTTNLRHIICDIDAPAGARGTFYSAVSAVSQPSIDRNKLLTGS